MPIQRLTFFFNLFFPAEKTKAVLQSIGKLGGKTSERRTELLLHGEGSVKSVSDYCSNREAKEFCQVTRRNHSKSGQSPRKLDVVEYATSLVSDPSLAQTLAILELSGRCTIPG